MDKTPHIDRTFVYRDYRGREYILILPEGVPVPRTIRFETLPTATKSLAKSLELQGALLKESLRRDLTSVSNMVS